jgi:hypothetical protein
MGVNISEDAIHWIGLLQYNPSTNVDIAPKVVAFLASPCSTAFCRVVSSPIAFIPLQRLMSARPPLPNFVYCGGVDTMRCFVRMPQQIPGIIFLLVDETGEKGKALFWKHLGQ